MKTYYVLIIAFLSNAACDNKSNNSVYNFKNDRGFVSHRDTDNNQLNPVVMESHYFDSISQTMIRSNLKLNNIIGKVIYHPVTKISYNGDSSIYKIDSNSVHSQVFFVNDEDTFKVVLIFNKDTIASKYGPYKIEDSN